jgi:putative peptide zinc metalloprotease protein
MYTRDAVLTVLPFTQQKEGDEVIIGRPETNVFLAVPPEAVEILTELSRGQSIGSVSDSYQRKYGEVPDLDDFLELLEAKGIVSSGAAKNGAGDVRTATKPAGKAPRYHFSNLPQSLAQRIFSKPVLFVSLAIVVFAAYLCAVHPGLAPRTNDLYFPDYRALSWLILLLASYATLFIHEMAHLVAARALGVSSRLGISHRLWYLVAETDLTGLWSVPKEKRYLPMLAGVIVDAVSGSLLLLLVYADQAHGQLFSPFAIRLMRAMAFTYLMRIAWQCLLYIRTDFYYVIAAFFNCKSLMRDTETYLRNRLSRFIPKIRKVNQSSIPAAERRVIAAYSFLWVGGRIAAVVLLCIVTIPLAIRYIRSLGEAFRIGFSANPSNFLDALLLAVYFLVPTIAGFILWARSMMRREGA